MLALHPDASQTDWSAFARLSDGDEREVAETLDRLARRYWPAMYAFVRSSGYGVHEAADLTQSFICDVVLGRGLLESADPSRGRFRSLLRTSLRHYLVEQRRTAARRRRISGAAAAVSTDPTVLAAAAEPGLTPDVAFDAQWVSTMVRQVLERLQANCLADGLSDHWSVFDARVVRPLLFGQQPAGYDELVERLDLDGPAQAANLLVTVKRRFASALLVEIRRTVQSDGEAGAELAELLRRLERHT